MCENCKCREDKDYYISFGQIHAHTIAGQKYNKDTIAVIKAKDYDDAHDKAMEMFNGKFCFVYEALPDMSYFPDGLVRE